MTIINRINNLSNEFFNFTYNYGNTIIRIVPILIKNIIKKKKNIQMITQGSDIKSTKLLFSKPNYIIDNIYIGSSFNAANLDLLNNYRITDIINLTENTENFYNNEFNYFNYTFINEDITIEDINNILDSIKNTMDNVLIHCLYGTNYSVFIIVCYLLRYKNMEVDNSLNLISNKRNYINFSKKLYDKLQEYYLFIKNNILYENTDFIV